MPASATGQRPGAAPEARSIRYAVAKRVCSTPRPGEAACHAIRLVPAAKGAPGATPYVSPSYAKGPAGGFAPSALAAAYGYQPTVATTQTVAIVDAFNDPHALADLNRFDHHYGLPQETAASFRKVNQDGDASPLPANNAGWSLEIALDIETVRAVCNRCRILLVEAFSALNSRLALAVKTAARLGATEISNSYGARERGNVPPRIPKAYHQPGIVVTASTGDDGWFGWDKANNGPSGWSDNAPSAPAVYPTVVAVTGTRLALNPDGTRAHETVWNENGLHDKKGLSRGFAHGAKGASGGGCSNIYVAPAWQSAVSGYRNTGCKSGKRLAGDVAALADPFTGFDIYSTGHGWITLGGTSLASPLVAAMWALAGGAGVEKYPAKSLYDRLHYQPGAVFDVRVGGNSFCGGDTKANCSAAVTAQVPGTGNPNNLTNSNNHYPGGWAGLLDCGFKGRGLEGTVAADKQCYATAGYDGPSGVGAPNGLTVFHPTRPTVRVTAPAVLQLQTVQTWSADHFTDGLSGALPSNYKWSWGDGTTTSTSSSSTTHKFTRAGTYKVTVTVTDSVGQKAAAAKTITVGVPV